MTTPQPCMWPTHCVLVCVFNADCCTNAFPQYSHLYGLQPSG